MPGVFVCYLRGDSAWAARAIADKLRLRLGKNQVFIDVDVPVGVDIEDEIDNALSSCVVEIVVLGDDWLDERLKDKEDHVRLEIERGLGRGLTLIPVLIDDSAMPLKKCLPKPLRRLAKLNAEHIRNNTFDRDITDLVGLVDRLVSNSSRRREAGSKPDAPN